MSKFRKLKISVVGLMMEEKEVSKQNPNLSFVVPEILNI